MTLVDSQRLPPTTIVTFKKRPEFIHKILDIYSSWSQQIHDLQRHGSCDIALSDSNVNPILDDTRRCVYKHPSIAETPAS